MAELRHSGDAVITGTLTVGSIVPGAGDISNSHIAAAAAIDRSKLIHEHRPPYAQPDANVVAERMVIHTVRGPSNAVVKEFGALLATQIPDTAPGSSGRTATIDLLKNGSSILTATIQLDSTNTLRTIELGTLTAGATLAQGDVLEVNVTIGGSVGTNPKGLFVSTVIEEKPWQ